MKEQSTMQDRSRGSLISGIRLRAAIAALVLAAALSLGAIAAPLAEAQTFTTLHSFDATDGAYPVAALVQGTDGNLYGTADQGGANTACGDSSGCGTVFKITPSGTLTTLYSFCSQTNCTDGDFPEAALVQATNGSLYGTTTNGGANTDCGGGFSFGCGTVFKITQGGTLTTLYSFCSQLSCRDGSNPYAGLVQATNGDFYGTTYGDDYSTNGTVFKITPSGTLTTLYNFCYPGCGEGINPVAGLVQATNGDFYGAASQGGAFGNGTIFKITPSGTLTTLYSFCSQSGCTDGAGPYTGLIQASNGNFYGTTTQGGAYGYGTVFKITPSATLSTLYSFCSQSGCPDGEFPTTGLIQASDGNFYGTTGSGFSTNPGTVFKITPSGMLTTLYSFCSQSGCPDGEQPSAGLVQHTNGNFYGTTGLGGAGGYGTVFSLSVGLGPFVETLPTSGKVGTAVKILGTNLTGATSVTFNGVAATFTVKSSSEITTTVPSGATTGKVKVTTPHGTLASNVNFRVLP